MAKLEKMTTAEFVAKCIYKASLNLEKAKMKPNVDPYEIEMLEDILEHYEHIARLL